MTTATPPVTTTPGARLIVPLLIGAAVSVALGVYGRAHNAPGIVVHVPGFSTFQSVKTWLATIATLFALVQVGSAFVMYGKVRGITPPTWIGMLHRWSGRIAFFVTIPVAVTCLYALGFQTTDTRILIHSVLGCLFFGVFTIKMLVLTKRGVAGWVLPLLGGLAFTILVGIWLTSALWFFTNIGVKL